MVVEEVGGRYNSHGSLLTSFLWFFLWVREDEIFVNSHKDLSYTVNDNRQKLFFLPTFAV